MNVDNKRVFLGGTCNGSTWREELISLLDTDNYFNPVVDDWNEEAKEKEDYEKRNCQFSLYVITQKMTGLYSIAEVVDDSNKKPNNTILCVLNIDDGLIFEEGSIRSLNAIKELVKSNGALVFDNLKEVAKFINSNNK